MNTYLVYRHIDLKTLKPFYVGMSMSKKRPFDFKTRTKNWFDVYNNTDIKVEILKEDLSKKDAQELERFIIEESNNLTNLYFNGHNVWNKGKELTKAHINKLSLNSGVSKEIICTKTNKKYKSLNELIKKESLIYSRGHLGNMLNNRRTNKTTYVWA